MAQSFRQMVDWGMPYAFAIRRRQSQASRVMVQRPSRAKVEEVSGVTHPA